MARLFNLKRRSADQETHIEPVAPEVAASPDVSATNVDLAAHMLHDAARFMRTLAEENPDLATKMRAMSGAYDAVADLVEIDPHGEAPEGVQDLLVL